MGEERDGKQGREEWGRKEKEGAMKTWARPELGVAFGCHAACETFARVEEKRN